MAVRIDTWNGEDLLGTWLVTRKADGVRGLWNGERWVSRKDKPLYNMPPYDGRPDVEVYCGSFKETISRVRASKQRRPIYPQELFSLQPSLDERLRCGFVENPTKELIHHMMTLAQEQGFEGLVLRQGDLWLKVKPNETFDVKVTAVIAGRGKHKGRMGALMTEMGKVGTGFTDEDRECTDWLDHVIEVECMHLTSDRKFRHARFIRRREDKDD